MSERRVVFTHRALPLLLIAPQLIITLIFFYWPAYRTVEMSLYTQGAFGGSLHFVGLSNFVSLWHNSIYLHSFGVTVIYSTATTLLTMAIALLMAAKASQAIRGGRIYQALLTWPYAVAPAIAGVLWLFLMTPDVGLIARGLAALGLPWNYHTHAWQAMTMVVAASAWRQVAYNFLFFMAAMLSIPRSLIEAAAIDGASRTRRFWTIVFPLLAPTAFFLLVINLIYSFFETYGVIDTMTQGGPANATDILVYEVYQTGVVGSNLGSAAAQSVVLMVFIIGLTAVQFRFIESRIRY